jgi:iron complex outermembrane receptor protein
MSLYRVTPANLIVTDFFGSIEMAPKYFRFRQANAVDKGRNSTAIYGDLEYDVTEKCC